MATSLISNPPFNLAWEPPQLAGLLAAYRRGVPPKNNANYAFILHAVENTTGKAALILPLCVLTPQKEEKKILISLIESNLLRAVIALPERMFESTSISVCVLLFDHQKQTRKIEMIDLRAHADEKTREQKGQYGGASHMKRAYKKKLNVLPRDVMTRCVNAIEKYSTEKGFCIAVDAEEIKKQDFVITPSRYVDNKVEKKPHRPFEDIVADYNRVIDLKNEIKITMNYTVARRLGFDRLGAKVDLSESFAVVGATAKKDNAIAFTKSDGIEFKASTKDKVPHCIIRFLNDWKSRRLYLNDEENRILAEFRDALLEDLMTGKVQLNE